MKVSFKAVAFLFLLSCASINDKASYAIDLQSFECMGNCPVYKVSIESDRNMTFQGIKNSKEGVSTYKISKAEYAQVTEMLDEILTEDTSVEPILSAVDSGGKEMVVIVDGEEKILALDTKKPRMKRLDAIMNQILSSRGLID